MAAQNGKRGLQKWDYEAGLQKKRKNLIRA